MLPNTPTLRPCGTAGTPPAAIATATPSRTRRSFSLICDWRPEICDWRPEAARELTDRGSVGCAYSWRDIGDAPLAAGCADRHGVGRTRHRALPDRDRIGGGSLHHGAGAERRTVHRQHRRALSHSHGIRGGGARRIADRGRGRHVGDAAGGDGEIAKRRTAV